MSAPEMQTIRDQTDAEAKHGRKPSPDTALREYPAEARPAPPAFMARRRREVLARAVAEEVVPRLLLAPRPDQVLAAALPSQDVEELVALVLGNAFEAGSPIVDRMSGRMGTVDALCLDLLSPAACRLGAMWEDDTCDFVQVTTGLVRLQQIMATVSVPFAQDGGRYRRTPRVLLVPGPGDQHSFGLSMVTTFFQRAGWAGWSGVPANNAELVARVGGEWFGVVGFSISNARRLDALTTLIRTVRRASRNREVGIMVGGPVFNAHPELVAMVGADATASDGRQAVLQAQQLLSLIPSRD